MAEDTQIGKMVAYIGLDPKEFELGLARSKAAFTSAMGHMDKLAGHGKMFLTGHAIGLMTLANEAAELEGKLIRLKAVTGATAEEFESLQATSERLSSTTELQDTQILGVMTALAQRGRAVKEINELVVDGAKLARATATDMGAATLSLDQAIRRLGASSEERKDVMDLLAKAANTSGIELGGLGAAFKMVGPVMKSTGFTAEETTAALDAMAQAGMQGAQAGRMLRGVYSGLSGTNRGAAKELKDLGVETRDASGQLRSLADILEDVKGKTANLNETERQQSLGKIFGMGSFAIPELTENLPETMGKYAGGAAKGYADQMASIEDSFSRMKTRLQKDFGDLKEGLGMVLLPNVKSVVDFLERITIALKNMSPEQTQAIAKWLESAAALSAAAIAGQKILGTVGGLAQGVAGLRRAFDMTAGSASILTGGIAALGVALGMYAAAAAKAKIENISLGEALDRLYFSWLTGSKNLYALMDAQDKYRKLHASGENLQKESDAIEKAFAEKKNREKKVKEAAAKSPEAELAELKKQADADKAKADAIPEDGPFTLDHAKEAQVQYEKQKAVLDELVPKRNAAKAKLETEGDGGYSGESMRRRAETREREKNVLPEKRSPWAWKRTKGETELQGLEEDVETARRHLAEAAKEVARRGPVEDHEKKAEIRKQAKDSEAAYKRRKTEIENKARNEARDKSKEEIQKLAESYERERQERPELWKDEKRSSLEIATQEVTMSQDRAGKEIVDEERENRRRLRTAMQNPRRAAGESVGPAPAPAPVAIAPEREFIGPDALKGRSPTGLNALEQHKAGIAQRRLEYLEAKKAAEEKAVKEGKPAGVLPFSPEGQAELQAEIEKDGKHGIKRAGEVGESTRQQRQSAMAAAVEAQAWALAPKIAREQAERPDRQIDKRSAIEQAVEEASGQQDPVLKRLLERRSARRSNIKTLEDVLEIKPSAGDREGQKRYQNQQASLAEERRLLAETQGEIDKRRDEVDLERKRKGTYVDPQETIEKLTKQGLGKAAESAAARGSQAKTAADSAQQAELARLNYATELKFKAKPEFTGLQDFWKSFSMKLGTADREEQRHKELMANEKAAQKTREATLAALQQKAKAQGLAEETP